jgi:mercuric ion binding protein
MNGKTPMIKLFKSAALGLLLLFGLAGGSVHLGNGQAIAGSPAAVEKKVTLTVQNMFCDACPFIVKNSLEAVPGVAKAVVSYKSKTAVVTYDDTKATVAALIKATTDAGYPSAPKN